MTDDPRDEDDDLFEDPEVEEPEEDDLSDDPAYEPDDEGLKDIKGG